MKRGDIYFITRGYDEEGSEQRAGRPAIIVSNDKCNENSSVLEVVYLTTQPKTDLPTHVDIRSAPKSSVALCEQINSIFRDRFGEYIATCTDYEMMLIDAALQISLGLKCEAPKPKYIPTEKSESKSENDSVLKTELKLREMDIIRITAERDTYKSLLERMVLAG